MNDKQTTALWMGILVLVAVGASALILWDLSNRERRQLEDGRNLSPADLSKVSLEPMEISIGLRPPRTYLRYQLYNGTNRPLVEAQVTLYVRMYGDIIWGRAGTCLTFEEARDMTTDEAQRWRNTKSVPSAESAREYKQELDCIGPVPPNSWYEGYVDLSNCPFEVTYTPDGESPAHWRIILNAVKWEKQKESSLCAVAANWRYLAFPAAAVVLIVGWLIFTLRDRVPKGVNDLTEKQPRNPVKKPALSHSYASLPSHPGRRASVGQVVKSDAVDVGLTVFEPEDREKNGQPEIEAGVLGYSVAEEMSDHKRYESPTRYQPPKVRHRKRTIWPTVLGSLSILLAGNLAIGAVLAASFMPRLNIGFATEQAGAPVSNSGADFVETGFSAFAFCLCLLLAVSGIFTLIRRRIARPLSMLAGAVLGASAIMSFVTGLLTPQSFPSDMNAWSQVGYAIGGGFGTIFPIVLLLWFLRKDVQAEVSRWP